MLNSNLKANSDRIKAIDKEIAELEHPDDVVNDSKLNQTTIDKNNSRIADIDQELAMLENSKSTDDEPPTDSEPFDPENVESDHGDRDFHQKLGLVAINANFAHDKKELAHDYAERELNAENSSSNFIKRIWKGNLFKKYYEKKYEREIMEGKREITLENGEKANLDQIIEERSGSAIERFVLGLTKDYGEKFIHEGETKFEANAETTAAVDGVIRKFASDWAKNNATRDSLKDNQDIKHDFNEAIKEELAKLSDSQPDKPTEINNYYDTAIQAYQNYIIEKAKVALEVGEISAHEVAMDRVMAGFAIYNADVRNNVRSEAHRDSIDKVTNWVENSAIGSIIPAEFIAGAVGAAFALTQSGTRAIAGAAGGIGVSSIFAGLRERNRVTEDRARMMRDLAVGLEYKTDNKRRSKYESKIFGTKYQIAPATKLTEDIKQAMASGDSQKILNAIAAARVRIDLSDSLHKDLIAYTSADQLGDERLALDKAVIEAEHSLTKQTDQQSLQNIKDDIQSEIYQNITEQDRKFHRLRAASALKQAGKSLVIGSVFFLGSQEVMAAFDPNKIGLLEKMGIIKTQNNDETAAETILASLAGPRVSVKTEELPPIKGIRADQKVEIAEFEKQGYTKVQVKPASAGTRTEFAEVSPANATNSIKVNTTFANNGTKFADGNELGLQLENGRYVANMAGSSSVGNQALNFEQLASADKIKAHINIGGGTFEVQSKVDEAGRMFWPIDASGNITTTTGETIQAFGSNGEKLFKTFRVVVDNGVDADNVHQVISLATDTGADTFAGTIEQLVEVPVQLPAVYNFVKTVPHEYPHSISFNGIVPPVVPLGRPGLGRATTLEEAITSPGATGTEPTSSAPNSAGPSSSNTSSTTGESGATIRDAYLPLVGDIGLTYMTGDRIPTRFITDTMWPSWWSGLDSDVQTKIINDVKAGYPEFSKTFSDWVKQTQLNAS